MKNIFSIFTLLTLSSTLIPGGVSINGDKAPPSNLKRIFSEAEDCVNGNSRDHVEQRKSLKLDIENKLLDLYLSRNHCTANEIETSIKEFSIFLKNCMEKYIPLPSETSVHTAALFFAAEYENLTGTSSTASPTDNQVLVWAKMQKIKEDLQKDE